MSTYDENIYYNPEKHGLSVFYEVETAGSYEFDTTMIWQNNEGNLYWAHDSGCSCPTPFEDFNSINDLNILNQETFHGFEEHLKNQYNIGISQFLKCIQVVKNHLRL